MYIRRAAVDRIKQHLLHIPDDGGIVDLFRCASSYFCLRLVTSAKINIFEGYVIAYQLIECTRGAFAEVLDQGGELVFFNDHGLERRPGRKLEF